METTPKYCCIRAVSLSTIPTPQPAATNAQTVRPRLASIPSAEIQGEPQANILFCRLPFELIDGLLATNFEFYHNRWEPGGVRFVTSFATTQADVDDLVLAAKRLAG